MKYALLSFLAALSSLSHTGYAASPDSAISLAEGSEFSINLSDPELLANEEKEWIVLEDSWRRRCKLSFESHYDPEFTKNVGSVIYKLDQFHGQNTLSYYNQKVRDQFNVWLTTDNKDLPLIGFDCFQEVPIGSPAPKKFTFRTVTELIGQPDFFLKPVLEVDYTITPFDLLPKAEFLIVGEPLHFSAEQGSSGSSLTNIESPRIREGRILADEDGDAQCSISYSQAKFEPYDVTIPVGAEFQILYFQLAYGRHYSVTAEAAGIGLDFQCSWDEPISDFSVIRNEFGRIVEFH